MSTPEQAARFELYAPDTGAFQGVPASTTDLCVNLLQPNHASEMDALGQRLHRLEKLALMNAQVESLDFLRSFPAIRSFYCGAPDLKDFGGLAHCRNLTYLSLGATFSSRPSLRVLDHLSLLEAVRLEGPNPCKGMEDVGALLAVNSVDLYSPKFSLAVLPHVFPNAEKLSISQGSYRSLDFITGLTQLSRLSVAYARNLTEFGAVGAHPSLHDFELRSAISGLRSCSQLGVSASIKRLVLSSCKNLEEVGSLAGWPALETIRIESCPKVAEAEIRLLEQAGKKVI